MARKDDTGPRGTKIDDLGRRLADVIAELKSIAEKNDEKARPSIVPHPVVPWEPWELAVITLRRRRERDELFGGIFADPGWDLLLLLFVASSIERKTTMSAACRSMGVPPTTALRWVNVMVDAGHVQRMREEDDRRLVYLSLTPAAQEKMTKMMSVWLEPVAPGIIRRFANLAPGSPSEDRAHWLKRYIELDES